MISSAVLDTYNGGLHTELRGADAMNDSDRLKENIDTLKEDVSKLRSDLSGIAEKILDIGGSAYSSKSGELGAEVVRLFDEVGETIAKTRLMSGDRMKEVERRVGERPFFSVLTAFLLGVLVGKLYGGE